MKTKTDETQGLYYTLGTSIPVCQLGDLAERLKDSPGIEVYLGIVFHGPDQMTKSANALSVEWLRNESPTNDDIVTLIREIRKPLERAAKAKAKAER